MVLDTTGFFNISKYIEGFLYGLYSGVFALYLHYAAKKGTTGYTAIVFYALCVLYILTGVVVAVDMLVAVLADFLPSNYDITLQFRLQDLQPAVFGCCDFIAQFILIYRCWIMWGCSTRVVIIPIIMALAYLAMWMASIAGNFILSADSNDIVSTTWSTNVDTASLVMSMTSNALVTGLIVFRIFEVFREVKGTITSALYEKSSSLGAADGGKLRYIMFVIIESGMALFSIQLARVVCTALRLSTAGNGSDLDAFNIIVVTHEMLNGIVPTIILVRVSMGLSFHDETSLIEAAGSMRFVADDSYAIPELSISQENDTSSICGNDDIRGRSASETIDKSIELKDTYTSNGIL